MNATISLSRVINGTENSFEATYNGEKWACDDAFLADLLNRYTQNHQLRDYHPNVVIGTAQEIAADFSEGLKARFVRADEIDYSDVPENALF